MKNEKNEKSHPCGIIIEYMIEKITQHQHMFHKNFIILIILPKKISSKNKHIIHHKNWHT